jgi:Zn-dependent alcohol dehydrogenase
MEKLRLRDIGEKELVVRIVASGVCHTDLLAGSVRAAKGGRYPQVLGHEGENSGIRFILLIPKWLYVRIYLRGS